MEGEIEGEEEVGTGLESPFFIKNRKKRSSTGLCKKKRSKKSVGATPWVIIEGELDEIGDVVSDATKHI